MFIQITIMFQTLRKRLSQLFVRSCSDIFGMSSSLTVFLLPYCSIGCTHVNKMYSHQLFTTHSCVPTSLFHFDTFLLYTVRLDYKESRDQVMVSLRSIYENFYTNFLIRFKIQDFNSVKGRNFVFLTKSKTIKSEIVRILIQSICRFINTSQQYKKSHMHNQSNDQQSQQYNGKSFSKQQLQSINETEGKQSRLIKKKINKFRQQVQKAISFINPQQIQEAIQMIKRVLIQIQDLYLNLCPFKGQGFKEDWEEYLLGGPMEWFMKNKETDNLSKNPFDLLSLCYAIQMNKNTNISTEYFFDFYDELQQKYVEQCFQIQIGKGHLYYANSQYYEAQKHYQKAMKVNKSQQKLLQCLAWIKIIKFKDQSKGQLHIQNCLELNPNNFGALFLRALTQKDRKKQSIEKLIEKNPQYYRLYVQRGILEPQLQNKQKWFHKALSSNPSSILANIALIIEQLNSTKFYRMSRKISETRFLARQQPDILFFLAQIQDSLSQKEAIKLYEKCLELNPYYFQAMQGLAKVYRRNTQIDQLGLEKAISLYKRYIECNPYNCEIYNYLGMALEEVDQKEQAVNNYLKALQINPQFLEAYLNIGQFYLQVENYGLALTYCLRAAQLSVHDANVCYGIAICYYCLGNYEQSQVWAQRCYKNGCDETLQVYSLFGDINLCKKLYFQSLKWYLKHVQVNRQLRSEHIIQNLIKKISRQQAIQILKQVYQLDLRSQYQIYYMLQLGILFQHLFQYEQAIKVFRSLNKLTHSMKRIPSEIKKQLQRVFNDKRATGTLSLESKVELMKLQKNYFAIFKQAYNPYETVATEKQN